jgi:hypothetical protein
MNCYQYSSINWIEVLTAIGTFGAVVVTLSIFSYKKISKKIRKPKLKLGVHFSPPECHKMLAVIGNTRVDAYWFRLYVENFGKRTAKDVDVIIEKIYIKIGDEWRIYSVFLPSNLLWTHIGRALLSNLQPGSKKNVDFGYILEPSVRSQYPSENNPAFPNHTGNLFNISTTVRPSNGYNIIKPGEYRFQIFVGAKNCIQREEYILLKFSQNWKVDEIQMLNESVSISKM